MYIPKVKSLKDLLLWLPRLVFNLGFKAHAFLVTALAILPIVLTTFEIVHTPEGEIIKIEEGCYLTTGNFEGNEDSIYIKKDTDVRLLAQQNGAFWAETIDGKNRGFLKAKGVGTLTDTLSLVQREKYSCYLISEKKFKSIIEKNTLDEIQEKYLNAEYIKTKKDKTIAEFGFKVFVGTDATGEFKRPIVTYNENGEFVSYELVFWHLARAKMIAPEIIDLMAPIASISEFPIKSPFKSILTEKMWIYLPGFALLGLFAILLVLRIPLIWLPNPLAGFVLYWLALLPPFIWLSTIRTYGLAGRIILPYLILTLLNLLLLWVSYSGLRCPRCKHLNVHEFIAKRNGRNYWQKERSAEEVDRGPRQNEFWSLWKQGKHWFGDESSCFSSLQKYNDANDKSKWEIINYREHTWQQTVTYRDKVTHRHIQEVINSYKCPHCGHGKDEIEETVIESKSELSRSTYTKTYYYSEKVSNDNRIFDQKCKER